MRDVSRWERTNRGSGTRESYWLREPEGAANQYLVKLPRERTTFITGEAWAEVLAAEVGRVLGLSVPECKLVLFGGKTAVLVKNFLPPGYDLREGVSLTGSERGVRHDVGLERVVAALAHYLAPDEALIQVTKMILFDILIANFDRHQENWGVLLPPGPGAQAVMAPYYDNGAGFGSSLGPAKLSAVLTEGWDSFDRGFRYVIGLEANRKAGITALFDVLAEWDRGIEDFMTGLAALTDDRIAALVDTMPTGVMSVEQRQFAAGLLRHRRDLLLRLISGRKRRE